jgi:hypothetical protein
MKLEIYKVFEALEKKKPFFWDVIGVILVALFGVLDYLTGNEIVFTLFYFIPIVLVTLAVNEQFGVFLSLLSSITLLVAEIEAGQSYSHPSYYLLNTLIRTVFYSFVVYLVAALHRSQKEERLAARTDFVTGAVNARYFNELLQMEVERTPDHSRLHRY